MQGNEHVAITVRENTLYKSRRFAQGIAYKIFGPVTMTKFYYRIVMKKKLNLESPKLFTEKINWYKLYYCPNNELVVQCSDKYSVRSFLNSIGLAKYLSKLIGVWDNPYDICWNDLPNRFALKNSNGCGYNIICSDKSFLDELQTKRLLQRWLNDRFGYYNAEPHYEKSKKRIICEEYIEGKQLLPIDYKVHCMNGTSKVLQVCDERTSKVTKYVYYDMQGHPLPFGKYPKSSDADISVKLLAEMERVSNEVASRFPYVRVDFFINNGLLQISELTFTPSAGLKPDLKYGDGDLAMGKMLDIVRLKEENVSEN